MSMRALSIFSILILFGSSCLLISETTHTVMKDVTKTSSLESIRGAANAEKCVNKCVDATGNCPGTSSTCVNPGTSKCEGSVDNNIVQHFVGGCQVGNPSDNCPPHPNSSFKKCGPSRICNCDVLSSDPSKYICNWSTTASWWVSETCI